MTQEDNSLVGDLTIRISLVYRLFPRFYQSEEESGEAA